MYLYTQTCSKFPDKNIGLCPNVYLLFANFFSGVAGSVSAVVVDNLQYASENLSSAVNTVGLVVSDNIQMASDNLAMAMNSVSGNIHSATSNVSLAVNSVYSMFKQKTTEIQVRLLNNLMYVSVCCILYIVHF